MENDHLKNTIAAFDKENANDPHSESWEGEAYPKELLYGQRMSDILSEFAPNASEALQLAARSQHIRRWEIPREAYPEGRKGYLLWRSNLNEMHAKIAGEIMAAKGYDDDTILAVQNLLKKKDLRKDADAQSLEDVACIVFLKYYFSEFAPKHDDEKIKSILMKTIKKMSDKGIDFAKNLDNASEFLSYLEKE